MRGNPILATYDTPTRRIIAYGGLNKLRGNASAYFSLTGTEYVRSVRDRRGQWVEASGGAIHDTILSVLPVYADLAALHLSDADGVPMHALENGFYHLGGSHWKRCSYEDAAEHFRVPRGDMVKVVADLFGDHFTMSGGFLTKHSAAEAKARLATWVEAQKPRWKQEADACIKAHSLVTFGDV